MLLLLILDFCTEVSLIHLSVTLYSLMFPIPLPKLIEVPELTRAPITRLCQNVLSICPEKCIFASARAPIPICTTDEEGRFLIALWTVIYLVCWVLSVWHLSRSLKNWTFGLRAGQEWFKLCYQGIDQSGIGSWHVINTWWHLMGHCWFTHHINRWTRPAEKGW